ncbi:MAG: Pycsar system effector family protein [Roseiarcus sp.]
MVSSVQEHAVATQTSAKPPSDDLIQREIKYFRDFSAIYTDAIRSSDFKANIALLFLPLLMVPILSAHERGLAGVPLWVILAPFLAAYFCLILAIFPRYFRSEKSSFHLSRTAGPHHFIFTHDPTVELDEVRHRVALLSRILWWKTLYLRLSLGICLVGIPVFGISLAVLGV